MSNEQPLKWWYAQALNVQSAVNLGAVLRSLLHLWDHPEMPSDWKSRAQHPIVRMFVAKLADMCGLEYTYPDKEDDTCALRSKD